MSARLRPVRDQRRDRLTLPALLAAAIAVGLGSAWWAVRHAPGSAGAVRIGPWTGSTLAGSPDADAYTRARVALDGLLALGRAETMYYVARHDDSGALLRARCRYRIDGLPPPARWWSLTAYGDDLFLFDAPERRFSVSSAAARLDERGHFQLWTGPQAPGVEPWLPTPGPRGLVLTLRLYNPSATLQAAPRSLQAPTITRQGACP